METQLIFWLILIILEIINVQMANNTYSLLSDCVSTITFLEVEVFWLSEHILQDTAAFVFGSMSLLDKISNGILIALIQHFNPASGPHVDQYYR